MNSDNSKKQWLMAVVVLQLQLLLIPPLPFLLLPALAACHSHGVTIIIIVTVTITSITTPILINNISDNERIAIIKTDAVVVAPKPDKP